MALKNVDRYSIKNKCHISVKRYLMDIVDYVSFKEVFCSIMGIKSSPNNASDDLTCHLNLSYRIEEEFDPEISDFEKTIIINDDDLKHEYDKAVEAIGDFHGMEWFSNGKNYECMVDISGLYATHFTDQISCKSVNADAEFRMGPASVTYIFCIILMLLNEGCFDGNTFRGRNPFLRRLRSHSTTGGRTVSHNVDDWTSAFVEITGILSLRITTKGFRKAKQLRERATSFQFKYISCLDRPLRLISSLDEFLEKGSYGRLSVAKLEIDCVPDVKFDDSAVNHFCLGVSSRSPYLQFLSFYHSIEFYFNSAYRKMTTELLRNELQSVEFAYNDQHLYSIVSKLEKEISHKSELGFGNEKRELEYLVESCVHVPRLMKSLRRYRFDWSVWYSSNGVEFESDAPVIDWESDNVAGLIASRIYKVRNAIVHSKKQTFGAFIPFKHDRALSYEIPLVKCVAEEVIDNNSSRV